jgi:cobalt-zinc-cadmium efflux system protein
MIVGCLLLHATWEILRDASRVLLDGVPEGVDYEAVGRFVETIPGVVRVHDLHVWTMSPGHGAIQCHVGIESHECWPKILDALRTGLRREFGIDHVTVQPEWTFSGNEAACAVCAQGLCEEDFSGESRGAPAPELDLTGKI